MKKTHPVARVGFRLLNLQLTCVSVKLESVADTKRIGFELRVSCREIVLSADDVSIGLLAQSIVQLVQSTVGFACIGAIIR